MDKYKAASIVAVAVLITGWGLLIFQGFTDADFFDFEGPTADREKIAAIRINGTIDDFEVSEKVAKVARNDSFEAAILMVNSPGGGVYSSFQLEEAINTLAEKKPTVAIVNQIGASGAYLAISPVDNIYVHEQSLLGSLGVISVWVSYENRYEREGIDHYVFKTGDHKDMYEPWRGPTKEENRLINRQIENIRSEMLSIIKTNRNLSQTGIPPIAISGTTIKGSQAVKVGLADNVVLTAQEAIDKFTNSTGLSDYRIVEVN